MKLSVIGCGYLGATHAACMSSLGFEVVGVDTDQLKVDLPCADLCQRQQLQTQVMTYMLREWLQDSHNQ